MTLHQPKRAVAAIAFLIAFSAAGAGADDVRVYAKRASFEDAKFDLTNAIIARGLTIDQTGQIGRMLERTGPDVGSTKPLYTQAEFLTFCSAKLSRTMMEADLVNIGFCPYVVFLYEAAGKPGETVIGYRRPAAGGSDGSRKALADIDALLDDIVREAVK